MAQNFQKITPTERLIRLFKPDKEEIRNVYLYAIFAGFVSLSLPLGIQAIVNLIQGGRVNTAWVVLVVLVVAGVAINGILQIFQLRVTENLQQKVFVRAAFEFAYRLPRIKMEALYKHYAPELVNRFFDVISVQKGISKLLIDFSTAALQVIFGILLLSFYHPFFILFGLLLLIIVYGIIRYTFPKGLQTSLAESKQKYRVAYWLEEVARAYFSFKLYTNTDLALKRVNALANDYVDDRENHFRILVQQYSLLVMFKVIVAAGLLAIGGILVMQQLMNIGQFVAAEIIILTIMSSIEKLIMSLESIYDILTGLEKIAQVTDLELEDSKGPDLSKLSNGEGMHVKMENISFTYPNYYKPTLRNISLDIESGKRLAITGDNGAGKTTLLQLLAGFYDVNDGNLLYDEFPKRNLNQEQLRTAIGLNFTDEELFDGTIEENITMGREDIHLDHLTEISNKLFLTDFIKGLPDGYSTRLDPQGQKLPRSITQKMLLARSIIDSPRLLIMESQLKNLDEFELHSIVDYLISPERPWTLIAVTSMPYFLKNVDEIAYMRDGRVIELAPYQEIIHLINKNK